MANNILTLSERLPSTATEEYVYVATHDSTGTNIRFYSKEGYLRLNQDPSSAYGTNFKSVILKDPLKLFLASSNSQQYSYYPVTVSGTTYTLGTVSLASYSSSLGSIKVVLSGPGTVYIYAQVSVATTPLLINVGVSPPTSTVKSAISNSNTAFFMDFIGGMAIYSAGPTYMTLYNKADFSQISNTPFQYSSVTMKAHCVDNLRSDATYSVSVSSSYSYFNRETVSSTTTLMYYGSVNLLTVNNILNFGPYQYVVTIPTGSTSIYLNFVSKTTSSLSLSTLALSNYAVAAYQKSFVGFIYPTSATRVYFALIQNGATTRNFQSYYLTVDRCVNRDASSVCTQCLSNSGFYRMGTAANNVCNTTAEFAAGWGIDTTQTTNLLALPCIDTNCMNCAANRLSCTKCKETTGWYLDSTTCVHATISPLIPSGKGPNTSTGLVVACQNINCLLCKTAYTSCTGCNTVNGWYLDGTICKHATTAPVFPSGKGPNTSTGLVVPCQMANCLLCRSSYLTCTSCDTTNGWYLDGTVCEHATLSPIFPSGKGPNTATGLVVACQLANCLLCKASYTTCTGCNTASGWYLDVSICEHATLSPQFPSRKGPNTSTGQVVACQDVNCLLCKTSYTTCTGCDTASGWYLDGSICKHATSTPIIPSGKGPNTSTGLVVACQVTNCLLCKTTYTTCTGCNTGTGWYLDGNTCEHATLSPVIPTRKGPNTATGLVESCQDTNCLLCKNTYTTCTGCDNTTGWFLDGTICEHATLTPTIPSRKGPNTATGLVVACQYVNCLLCKTTYTTCTGCDTTTGWYLDGSICKHATNSPIIPSGKGPNTVSGLVSACQDVNCLLCKATYTTCTGCNSGTGWYLDGNTCEHATLTPQIPSRKGPNTSTGLVVACQDVNCLLCKTTYTTCTGCDTASGWYLDGSTCKHATLTPIIPSGKGPNTSTGVVVACQVTNCLLCKTTYTTCTGCNTGTGWYLDGNTCEHATLSPVIPTRKGPNTATGLVESCQDTNCLVCKNTYTTCTGCDTTTGWYLDGMICEHATLTPTIPSRKGPNTATGLVVACQDVNCLLCKTTYTTCTGCDTTTGWYLDGSTCKHATLTPTIPTFFGPNLALGTVVACQVAQCTTCKTDHQVCTHCNTATGWFLNGNVCQNAATFPVGMGPNLSNGLVETCSDSFCASCSITHLVCLSCNSAAQSFLDVSVPACVHQTAIADTYGPDLTTGVIVPCNDTNCQKCQANYSECSFCKVSEGYFLFKVACINVDNIPSGFGVDGATFSVKQCLAGSGCINCKMDYGTCAACDSSQKKFLNNSKCIGPSDFAPGYGVDLNSNSIAKCLDTNCVKCVDNYQICTECDQANGYILNGGSCKKQVKPPKLHKAVFDKASKMIAVEFTENVNITSVCGGKRANLSVAGDDGNTYSCQDLGCEITDIKPNGFSIKFNSQYSISYGTASIYKDDCLVISSVEAPAVEFNEYPVRTQMAFKEEKAAALMVVAESTASAASGTIGTSKVALMAVSPAAATQGDFMGTKICMLLMLSGPQVALPEKILKANSAISIPVSVGNPFEKWTASETCDLPDSFARNDLVCSIFGNYGEDLIVLMVTLAISGLVNACTTLALKKISKDRKKTHAVLQWIQGTFGLPFFIAKMDGNQFEILFYSVYHLHNSERTVKSVVGDVVALVIVCYIVYQMAAQFYLAVWIWRELEQKKNQVENLKREMEAESRCLKSCGLKRPELIKAVNLQEAPGIVRPVSLLFIDYLIPQRFHHLLGGLLRGAKNLVQTVVIIASSKYATTQVFMVMLAEIFYFGHTLVCNIKVSLSLRIVDIVTDCLMIAYLVAKLVTTYDSISEDTRQKQLATAMVVCVYGIIVVSISFALFSLMLILFQLSKQMIEKCRAMRQARISRVGSGSEVKSKRPEKHSGDELIQKDNSVAELKPDMYEANIIHGHNQSLEARPPHGRKQLGRVVKIAKNRRIRKTNRPTVDPRTKSAKEAPQLPGGILSLEEIPVNEGLEKKPVMKRKRISKVSVGKKKIGNDRLQES